MLIRKKVLWLTVTCLLALCFNSTGAAENTGTLIVDSKGFADSEGYAMVAVFDSEATLEVSHDRHPGDIPHVRIDTRWSGKSGYPLDEKKLE